MHLSSIDQNIWSINENSIPNMQNYNEEIQNKGAFQNENDQIKIIYESLVFKSLTAVKKIFYNNHFKEINKILCYT